MARPKKTLKFDKQGDAASLGVPEPPMDLLPEVQAVWDRVGPMLADLGVLTKADGLSLLMLCRAAADYIQFCGSTKVGADVLGGTGSGRWNMHAAARDKAEARLRSMLADFGLNPLARAKFAKAQKKAPADRKGKYFKAV